MLLHSITKTSSFPSKVEPLLQPRHTEIPDHLPSAAKESAHYAHRAKFDYLQCQAVIWCILEEQSGDSTADYLKKQRTKVSAGVASISNNAEWKLHRLAIKRSMATLTAGQEITEDYLGQYVRRQLELYISNDCSWHWIMQLLTSDAAEDLYMFKHLIKETKKQIEEDCSIREARKVMKSLGLERRRSRDVRSSLTSCGQWVARGFRRAILCEPA